MSDIKERILGAVAIMNDNDAEKLWHLIETTFSLSNIGSVQPDDDELLALDAFHNGDPEYQPSISHEDLVKDLGL